MREWGDRSFYTHDPFGNPICFYGLDPSGNPICFVDEATVFRGSR